MSGHRGGDDGTIDERNDGMDHDDNIDEHDETGALPAELTTALHDLVADERPSPDLRDRVAAGLGQRTNQRRWVPVAAAVLVAIVAAGAAFGLGADDTDSVDVATDPAPAATTDDADRDPAQSTTTTDAPTTTEVRVAGDSVEAPTTKATTAPATTAPTRASATTAAPTAQAPAVAPQPAPTTTTTSLVCRNSTNPDCGPFRWDPPPDDQAASLTVTAPAGPIRTDEQVELTLSMSDPDGPVTLDCYTVNLDRPGLSLGACSSTARSECPERYGPWTPPQKNPGQAETTTIVEFYEPGTYVVDVAVDAADGCDNVNPYRSPATARITVEVVASDA